MFTKSYMKGQQKKSEKRIQSKLSLIYIISSITTLLTWCRFRLLLLLTLSLFCLLFLLHTFFIFNINAKFKSFYFTWLFQFFNPFLNIFLHPIFILLYGCHQWILIWLLFVVKYVWTINLFFILSKKFELLGDIPMAFTVNPNKIITLLWKL